MRLAVLEYRMRNMSASLATQACKQLIVGLGVARSFTVRCSAQQATQVLDAWYTLVLNHCVVASRPSLVGQVGGTVEGSRGLMGSERESRAMDEWWDSSEWNDKARAAATVSQEHSKRDCVYHACAL